MTTLINSALAVTSSEVVLADNETEITLVAANLQGSEEVQVSTDAGWVSLKAQGRHLLMAENNFVTLRGRQTIRVVKAATQQAVVVSICGATFDYQVVT